MRISGGWGLFVVFCMDFRNETHNMDYVLNGSCHAEFNPIKTIVTELLKIP